MRDCNGLAQLGSTHEPLTPKKSGSRTLGCVRAGRQSDDELFRCPDGIRIFAKIGDIKGRIPRRQAQGRNRGAVVLLGCHKCREHCAGGGGGAGRATFQDLSFVHTIDKASPGLLQACATGAHLKEATITHRKAGKGQQEYLIIKMNDIIITGVSLGDTSDEAGSETVSLAFAKVDFEYRPQKADGSLDAGIHFKFDIKANKDG